MFPGRNMEGKITDRYSCVGASNAQFLKVFFMPFFKHTLRSLWFEVTIIFYSSLHSFVESSAGIKMKIADFETKR